MFFLSFVWLAMTCLTDCYDSLGAFFIIDEYEPLGVRGLDFYVRCTLTAVISLE